MLTKKVQGRSRRVDGVGAREKARLGERRGGEASRTDRRLGPPEDAAELAPERSPPLLFVFLRPRQIHCMRQVKFGLIKQKFTQSIFESVR